MTRNVGPAIERAARHLVDAQQADHLWHDYALAPGASTDWVTAVVAYALAGAPDVGCVSRALEHAQLALLRRQRSAGWGYNLQVAPDADTTSWVVRWFVRVGAALPIHPIVCLASYLGPSGGARTFAADVRFGTWGQEHADVSALVGLAMNEAGACAGALAPLRRWVLDRRESDGLWRPFWWSFDAYAVAHILAFLDATGGVPGDVADAASGLLWRASSGESTMELAHRVMIACQLGVAADRFAAELAARQASNGGWSPSRVLRLPDQSSRPHAEEVFEDVHGLMSTAMALMALTRYREEG